VWICDFGSSRSEDDTAAIATETETGSVHYAAPEQYEDGFCTTKLDVFAFGLVLYEMLTRVPVFHPSQSPFTLIQRLRAHDLPETFPPNTEI
jgi:serine/threonine-protein kinase